MKKFFFLFTLSLLYFPLFSLGAVVNNDAKSLYLQALAQSKTHQFNENQIKSFVYYWFSLHDKHAPIDKSLVLLNKNHLLMIYPEITVHNLQDYQKWYEGVGNKIANNLHEIKQLQITFLPNHQYQVDIIVNWQGFDKQNNFINVLATQRWLLIDGTSKDHPYITRYQVLSFKPIA